MPRTPAARARGISKYYGEVIALDGVDLDVEPGRVHGLVGPNGAGKTTLLGLLLGLAVPDEGTLEVLGRAQGRSRAVVDGVAGFVDGPGLYPSLTARQNLDALATLRGIRTDRGHRVREVLDQVGLGEVRDVRVRGFSLGMRQRLGLAAALLVRPRLLVLDEPANGLDPAGKRDVHEVLRDLTGHGAAIVLSSHRMDDLASLCADVTILAAGRAVFSGPLAKLAAEGGDVDHRLLTSDPVRARRVAAHAAGIRVRGQGRNDEALVVRGSVASLDALVLALAGAGVAVRELAPVVAPLEDAFLALIGGDFGDDAA